MLRVVRHATWLLLAGVILAGCQRSPGGFGQVPYTGAAGAVDAQQVAQLQAQLQTANQRASQLDRDNQDLSARLAQSQQQVGVLQDEMGLVRQRLGDTARQLRDLQDTKVDAEQQLAALQASTQRRGGAIITANNSLRDGLRIANVPGADVRLDGDVVRIELSSDRLFVQGTAQLQQSAYGVLDQVGQVVRQNYPRQIIVIESHTDNTPASGLIMSNHALSSSQAVSVLTQLTRSGSLPAKQMRTMAYADTQPRFSNANAEGRARNRRIELVVYPETYTP